MVNIDEIERENFVLRSSIEANGTLRRKKHKNFRKLFPEVINLKDYDKQTRKIF